MLVRGVALEVFKIPSASMLPTLQMGDYLVVNKLRYGVRLPGLRRWMLHFGVPQPGDVIVFTSPKDRSLFYVKRVVAVAGEVVEIRDKQLFVNGVPQFEPTAHFTQGSHVQTISPRDNFGPARVPRRHVFVLGDNRDQSFDSRYWGFVDLRDVEGKAFMIYWSADGDDGWVRWERMGKLVP